MTVEELRKNLPITQTSVNNVKAENPALTRTDLSYVNL